MKVSTIGRRLLAGAIAAAVAVPWLPAAAATEEITVFARKRPETLQDVPATVTVFTETAIERSNITRAADIAFLTPGLTLVDAAEIGDTQVNIRGLNGARDAENNYALVIDGITYTNPASLNREYANLQQIEVLKGPQGAIYGRNASAGAFIITTRLPDEGLEGEVRASGAQDETYSLTGNYGGRISDNLLGSVQGEFFTTDGFYNNEFLNRDDIMDNQEIWSVGGRLLWEVSDTTSIDTKLRVGEAEGASILFNSVFHIPFLAGAFMNPAFDEDVNEHPNRYVNNVINTNDQESLEFSAKLESDLGFATLTAWGLYSDIENELGADGASAAFGFFATDPVCQQTAADLVDFPLNPPQFNPGDPTDPNTVFGAYTPTTCDGTQYQRRFQEDYSFEVRLASNEPGEFEWMVGLYYLNIEREVAVSTGVDRINPPSFRGGTVIQQPYTTDPTNPTEQLVWDEFDTDVYSVFGQLVWNLSDTFTADLALRYDKEERSVKNLVPTVADGAVAQFINPCDAPGAPPTVTPGVDAPLNPGLCATGAIDPQEEDFSEFQPKISLKWDAWETTSLFASWGKGFRSGGFNNQGTEATINTFINLSLLDENANFGLCDPSVAGCVETGRSAVGIKDSYDKETISAFEVGFKSLLADGNVRLEGAAYYTDVDDMQFFEFVVGPFGLLRVVENIDEVEIKGVEASITWDAADWLDLYAGGNINDSEIKANSVRPDSVGNESPYTPDYTANIGAYFTVPMGDAADFFTNIDMSLVGPTWFHVIQAQDRPIGFEALLFSNAVIPGAISPGNYTRRNATATC